MKIPIHMVMMWWCDDVMMVMVMMWLQGWRRHCSVRLHVSVCLWECGQGGGEKGEESAALCGWRHTQWGRHLFLSSSVFLLYLIHSELFLSTTFFGHILSNSFKQDSDTTCTCTCTYTCTCKCSCKQDPHAYMHNYNDNSTKLAALLEYEFG